MNNSLDDLQLKSDRILFVEGNDDSNLIRKMLAELSFESIQVIPVGGKYEFSAYIQAVLGRASTDGIVLRSIAVLRDADDYPDRAMQSLSDALKSLGLQPPKAHNDFSASSPSVGIFIMPDGESPGSVEHLCWRSVKDTPAAQCVDTYMECLKESQALQSKQRAKTQVHAYLAAQEEPSTTVGVGARKGYWPLDHRAFAPLKEFLSELAMI